MTQALKQLVIVGVLLVLTACQSADTDGTLTAEEGATMEAAVVASGKYFQLTGVLADRPVTMELQEEQASNDEGAPTFRGFYRYDDFGGPIAVYGGFNDNRQLVLTEQGSWEGEPHLLQGTWNPRSGYVGDWRSGNGKDVYPFAFQLETRVPVSFSAKSLRDSVKAFPQWPYSPELYLEIEWLDAQAGTVPAAQVKFLRSAIAQGLFAEGVHRPGEDLTAALTASRNQLFQDYQEEMRDLRKDGLLDSLGEPDEYLSYNYAYSTSMQVYYNAADFVTLGYTDYSYTGGAHGIYATRVESYDLTRQRILKISDILLPGYERKVSEALAQAIRIKYNLSEDAPLSAILFEDGIEANENFGITNKGIFFVYTPYEIAPYVAGEIELFVAFANIKEFVKPEWLEKAGLNQEEE